MDPSPIDEPANATTQDGQRQHLVGFSALHRQVLAQPASAVNTEWQIFLNGVANGGIGNRVRRAIQHRREVL
jgi:hypothetical protein